MDKKGNLEGDKMEERSSFSIIAIVAIVAIVGLVVMFKGGSSAPMMYSGKMMSGPNHNMAGQAYCYIEIVCDNEEASNATSSCLRWVCNWEDQPAAPQPEEASLEPAASSPDEGAASSEPAAPQPEEESP